MATAVSRSETTAYVLRADREKPINEQTTFHLCKLSASIMFGIANLKASGMREGDVAEVIVKASLRGWTNFLDAHGQAVKFETHAGRKTIRGVDILEPPTDMTLEYVSFADVQELAMEALAQNTLTRDDVKN